MKFKKYFDSFIVIIIGVFIVVGSVQAATTISENIATGGTLSVTGTTTLLGQISIGTTTFSSSRLITIDPGENEFGLELNRGSNGFLLNAFRTANEDGSTVSVIGNYEEGSSGMFYNGNEGQTALSVLAATDAYAISSSGGINYLGGDVGIYEVNPAARLHIVGQNSNNFIKLLGGDSSASYNSFEVTLTDNSLDNFGAINVNLNPEEGINFSNGNGTFSIGQNGAVNITTAESVEISGGVGITGNLNVSGTTNGVKVYRALLTQTGTNAPVATVLENSLGGTVVWTRSGIGQFIATLEGAFPAGKSLLLVGSAKYDLGAGVSDSILHLTRVDTDSLLLTLINANSGNTEDSGDVSITDTPIQILVYP